MLAVDTSAVLAALTASEPPPGLAERLANDGDLHAPHLIDTKVLHALRRMTISGQLTEDRAADARTDFADLALTRYPHQPLSDRIWQLRHNLTAYDATFVALAEALDAPLITCDARLTTAPNHNAKDRACSDVITNADRFEEETNSADIRPRKLLAYHNTRLLPQEANPYRCCSSPAAPSRERSAARPARGCRP